MLKNEVVSRDEWIAARKALQAKEKQLTRQRDQLAAERRSLPWVKIEKPYHFDSPAGKQSLADLFSGRSQLIVQHFMFAPDWREGCVGCSLHADHAQGALVHLENRDVSYVAISRAPLPRILEFKQRMGWRFNWVSSYESDFNFDFHVSFSKEQLASGKVYYNFQETNEPLEESSGMSVFYRDEHGDIYHTYSSYARANEEVLGVYVYLDITPKGRNETGPYQHLGDWARHHDRYGDSNFDFMAAYQTVTNGPSCCHT